ncbi:MAG: histidine--tRNA ligase [Patescibacteria group bacterium]
MPKQKNKTKLIKSVKPQLFQSVKGMNDILPKDEKWWQFIFQNGRTVSELHDFHYIETPVLENAALFEHSVGAGTDIVEKQMYVFKTKGDDRVALRPEGTSPVMRSYLEHHLGYFASPLKVYYCEQMFRYERPQAGRERQHHQWGFEILGDSDPIYDGEIILAVLNFLKNLKFKDLNLKINTIGCRVCRPNYREKLKNYYASQKSKLCKDCLRRLDSNPLRLLDCEEPGCVVLKTSAPIILDYLCQNCNNHFKAVLELIEDNKIVYEPDPYLVRGLDYYNRTVFEVYTSSSKSALGGGGRYDYLSELISGRAVPGVGAGIGLERLIEAMRTQEISPIIKSRPKVFFIAVGEQAKRASLRLMNELRSAGVAVQEVLGKKSIKAQLKAADKASAPFVLIFGQKEFFEGTIILRDMNSSAQETIILSNLVQEVKKRLK